MPSEGSRDCTHSREDAQPPSPTALPLCSSPQTGRAGMSQDESTPAGSRGQLALIMTTLAAGRRTGGLRSSAPTSQLSDTARTLGQHRKDTQKPCAPLAACLICEGGDRVPEIHINTRQLSLPSLAGHQNTPSRQLPSNCRRISRFLPSEIITKTTIKIYMEKKA